MHSDRNLCLLKFNIMMLSMTTHEELNSPSPMRDWMRKQQLTYRSLACLMGQSASNLCKKIQGDVEWQSSDLRFLHDEFGLSSDFVLGLGDEAGRAGARLEVV